jgi:hypothetical protein
VVEAYFFGQAAKSGMGKKLGRPLKDQRYSRLLVLLMVLLAAGTLLPAAPLGDIVFSLIFFGAVLQAIDTSTHRHSRWFKGYVGLAAIGFSLEIIRQMAGVAPSHSPVFLLRNGIYSAFMILSMVVITQQLFQQRQVTKDLLQGAICVYLLAATLWADLYQSIAVVDPKAFYFALERQNFNPYLYFSFMTLTTTGYGDIVPANRVVMLLANLQSLFGQLFPAIVIARLVSLYDREKS